jgi:hypothetical protein
MNDLPSKERTSDLLMNWRCYSKDCPPDPAQVHYYTVSPMFTDIIPRGTTPPYDTDAALMVEEVLRVMFRPYPQEWSILRDYYGRGMPQCEIAERLGINQSSVCKYRLPAARRIFAEQWALLIRKA